MFNEHLVNGDNEWVKLNNLVYYRKKGNVVTVTGFSGGSQALTINDYTNVGTLPLNYRPSRVLYTNWSRISEGQVGVMRINPNGIIELFSTSGTNYWGFTISFII